MVHKCLQFLHAGVSAVADPVTASSLAHLHHPVLPRGCQGGQLALGEEHGAGLDVAHRHIRRLLAREPVRKTFLRHFLKICCASMDPGGIFTVRVCAIC